MGEGRETLEHIAAGNPVPYLTDPRPEIRRLAVAACSSFGSNALEPLARLVANDPDEDVRAEAVEVLGHMGPEAFASVWEARSDPATRVVESVVVALGEIGRATAVPWLMETVTDHPEPIVREAAVAALGAIGDDRALPTILEAAGTGKPQVRRRSVVALTAFAGPAVEEALTKARLDRNPMVREVAEMILGRN